MKFSIVFPQKFNGNFKASHRKEKTFNESYVAVDCKTKQTIVDVRFYGSGSTSYCCVWGGNSKLNFSASGSAGDYEKTTSFSDALKNEGFEVIKLFGYGSSPISDAIMQIAIGLGCHENDVIIINAHP